MNLYQIPGLDPELTVLVGWDATLASYVAQVEGLRGAGTLHGPDLRLVAWFGRHQGELGTVEDLQDAICEYAVVGSDIRAALEADRAAPAVLASASLRLVSSTGKPEAAARQARGPFQGRALRDRALMVGVAVVGVILVVIAAIAVIANLINETRLACCRQARPGAGHAPDWAGRGMLP
jgi:hypothetical protein